MRALQIPSIYHRSAVLAGDLVHDALHAPSVEKFSGLSGSVEKRMSQRVPLTNGRS
jgi:hypothetical protein